MFKRISFPVRGLIILCIVILFLFGINSSVLALNNLTINQDTSNVSYTAYASVGTCGNVCQSFKSASSTISQISFYVSPESNHATTTTYVYLKNSATTTSYLGYITKEIYKSDGTGWKNYEFITPINVNINQTYFACYSYTPLYPGRPNGSFYYNNVGTTYSNGQIFHVNSDCTSADAKTWDAEFRIYSYYDNTIITNSTIDINIPTLNTNNNIIILILCLLPLLCLTVLI